MGGNAIDDITPPVKVHVVIWYVNAFPPPETTIVGGEPNPVPPAVIV